MYVKLYGTCHKVGYKIVGGVSIFALIFYHPPPSSNALVYTHTHTHTQKATDVIVAARARYTCSHQTGPKPESIL